ncbi:hypothetical protein [Bizionia sp.]|uniref:hypothetical protein n=1 Tax=Bizionia sp. TaxID=1954480 RepID=UPI003A900D1B
MTVKERELIFTTEVDNQINQRLDTGTGSGSGSGSGSGDGSICATNRGKTENRCLRNYSIATGAAAIPGAISFGIGTLIGMGAATGVFIWCLEDAQNDSEACIANGG